MTPQAKSSRKRSDNRINRYVKSAMSMYYRLHPETQTEVQVSNRAKRRATFAIVMRSKKYEK